MGDCKQKPLVHGQESLGDDPFEAGPYHKVKDMALAGEKPLGLSPELKYHILRIIERHWIKIEASERKVGEKAEEPDSPFFIKKRLRSWAVLFQMGVHI